MKHLSTLSSALSSKWMRLSAVFYLNMLSVQQALAFGGDIPSIPGTAGGTSGDVRSSLVTVINFVLTFLALVAVIFVIIGGIRILASGGNEENVTTGRKTIVYAIIGLVIVFFARVIVGFFTDELAQQFT